MDDNHSDVLSVQTRFLVMFRSLESERLARLVIETLRTFGGPLGSSPVWAFVLDPDRASSALPGMEGVHTFPLVIEGDCPSYPFAHKVYACAKAEEMAGPEIRSLVWLSLDCLVINPPLLFDLQGSSDVPPAHVAFRPVHHQNVGSIADEPLDAFWQGIYQALEIDDIPHTIKSFVDSKLLRPYFNTHCFAFDPATGLGGAWWDHFRAMASDCAFEAGPFRDELHQVFLHQAILSTLAAKILHWDQIRLLPPEYNYPLNLLDEMPSHLRASTLNSLVNAVYEDAFPWSGIEIQEPLLSWLVERLPGRGP